MSVVQAVYSLFGPVRHLVRPGVCYYHNIIIREKQPSPIDADPLGGQRILPDPPQTLTEVEDSPAEFHHVEKLLPLKVVPEPPHHSSYPTPSGWVPQKVKYGDLPYFMKRTRFHNLPIYTRLHDGGSRPMTMMKYIDGDIWVMEQELREYLEKVTEKKMYTQVDEVCRKIRVRGDYLSHVVEFCLQKGL